ncbi:MAG: FRG domain-containing protein, partial [Bacteroidota bacterium]
MAINNIASFVSELQKIQRNGDHELFFRGHSDIEYELKPSIYRNRKLLANENKLFREFILRTPKDFLDERSALEKLVKMQHYGLPTRLLDLTTNPLVALYFACSSKGEKNGEVVTFKIPNSDIKYYDSDTVSILANLAKRSNTMHITNHPDNTIESFNEGSEAAYLLHEIKEEKPYFQPIIDPKDINRVVAVKVKQSNSRIIK